MLIIGAKGFAKELLEVLHQSNLHNGLAFFDNISNDLSDALYEQFSVIKSFEDARKFFDKNGPSFSLGLGNPKARKMMAEKMKECGGELTTVISPFARIGHFNNQIGKGATIMTGNVLTNDISIGEGVLINLNCTVGHDAVIGNYVELCPGVHVSGKVEIGEFSFIGTGAVILPGLKIGKRCNVGAGAVVNKDVPDDVTVIGIPAKPINK